MNVITLEDVKNILRIEVRETLMQIHHYEYGTNAYNDNKLKKSISRIDDNAKNHENGWRKILEEQLKL